MHKPLEHLTRPLTLVLLLAAGCGARAPSTPPPNAADEPTLEVETVGALQRAEIHPKLPMLFKGPTSYGLSCFETAKKPRAWQSEAPEAARHFEEHRAPISQTLFTYLLTDVFADIPVPISLDRHQVDYLKQTVLHVERRDITLADDQRCFTKETRDFPTGATTVTTLFGAKAFRFESPEPIPRTTIDEMRQAATKAGLRLVPENAYTPAVDKEGAPLRNAQKQRLFNSPSGQHLTKRELPPPKSRPVIAWKLFSPKPIYLAFGTLPKSAWKREQDPTQCEVYLVFDDAAPQVPSCAAFRRAGFGVARSREDGQIQLKIATGETTETATVPYNQTTPLLVAGKMILWVTPRQVEEGAKLEIDSLYLDTGEPAPDIERFSTAAKPGAKERRSPPPRGATRKAPTGPAAPPPIGY